ncbi:MAG: AAA-like domain-containing protein [Cyanobacteria bacterium P01_F01_bin.86]
MSFDVDQAIEAANQATAEFYGRSLNDVEILVLKGAWERDSYDQIAARSQYSASYISQDIAPKLWKLLSDALGEKIKKNSFKEPLKRYWETKSAQENRGSRDDLSSSPITFQSSEAAGTSEHPIKLELPYPRYIRRPEIETLCFETLRDPGTLIRLKSPKLTGKTSLINFVLARLTTEGIRTINLSLRMADRQHHFSNIDIFLRWFCFNVEQELGLESQLNRYWNAEWLGSKVSCTTYFEKCLLAQDDAPVMLCLDDIDLLFSYPELYEDFFGLLRSWYEKARSRPQWKKLRLMLAHSTEAYIRLNINQSPFNVGLPVELAEFTIDQAQQLAQRTHWESSPAGIKKLIALLGGHPYLLEKAFDYLKANPQLPLEKFLQTASTQSGIYRNHLQEIWSQLKANPELETAFHSVICAQQSIPIEPTLAYQLQSMGLIKLTGNVAQVTCQLYRHYFLANLEMGKSKP